MRVQHHGEVNWRMWEIVRAGGWMMGPIILASIVAVAIILERLWTLQDRRVLYYCRFELHVLDRAQGDVHEGLHL